MMDAKKTGLNTTWQPYLRDSRCSRSMSYWDPVLPGFCFHGAGDRGPGWELILAIVKQLLHSRARSKNQMTLFFKPTSFSIVNENGDIFYRGE